MRRTLDQAQTAEFPFEMEQALDQEVEVASSQSRSD